MLFFDRKDRTSQLHKQGIPWILKLNTNGNNVKK